MTNSYQKLKDLLNDEIAFHGEIENSWYWRLICKLFGKRECHEVLINELRFLKKCLGTHAVRLCGDCGKEFEPVDPCDWWCKVCLLKRYQTGRPIPSFCMDTSRGTSIDPPLTDSGPGGS